MCREYRDYIERRKIEEYIEREKGKDYCEKLFKIDYLTNIVRVIGFVAIFFIIYSFYNDKSIIGTIGWYALLSVNVFILVRAIVMFIKNRNN